MPITNLTKSRTPHQKAERFSTSKCNTAAYYDILYTITVHQEHTSLSTTALLFQCMRVKSFDSTDDIHCIYIWQEHMQTTHNNKNIML